MKKSFDEFVATIIEVINKPLLPLVQGRFTTFNSRFDRTLINACPLTQAALKDGLEMSWIQEAIIPEEVVVEYLKAHFDVRHEELSYFWNYYDNGGEIGTILSNMQRVHETVERREKQTDEGQQ